MPLLALHNLATSFQIMQGEPRLNSSLSKEAEAAQASGACTSASWSCVNGINERREGQLAPGCEHRTKAHPIKGVIRVHTLWWSCSCYMYSHYPSWSIHNPTRALADAYDQYSSQAKLVVAAKVKTTCLIKDPQWNCNGASTDEIISILFRGCCLSSSGLNLLFNFKLRQTHANALNAIAGCRHIF